jgi:hypothetical protein
VTVKQRAIRAGGTELAIVYGNGVRLAPGVRFDRRERRLMARVARVRLEARREPPGEDLSPEQQHARLLERDW